MAQNQTGGFMCNSVGILIVDDDEKILNLCCFYLTHCGYKCFKAKDADEAMELLKMEAGLKIVLSDYQMPGNENMEFIQFIRDNYPMLKTIMWSGCELDILFLTSKMNVHRFFQKPFKLSEVSESIRQAVG